jgi:hypothetical protein
VRARQFCKDIATRCQRKCSICKEIEHRELLKLPLNLDANPERENYSIVFNRWCNPVSFELPKTLELAARCQIYYLEVILELFAYSFMRACRLQPARYMKAWLSKGLAS